MQRLNDSPQIWRLAADLKVRHEGRPRDAILELCRRKIAEFRKETGPIPLAEFLEEVALRLRTRFIDLPTDAAVRHNTDQFAQRQEGAIATFLSRLDERDYGVTFRLQSPRPWELPFVSFIDTRGKKAPAAYFTKWHELAHLLTLTDQTRLSFQRTHVSDQPKDSEESLMDVIAGELAFPSDLLSKAGSAPLTFDLAEQMRMSICPDASRHAWLIAFSRSWAQPLAFVTAELRLKAAERAARAQARLSFVPEPVSSLRLANFNINDAGREAGLQFFPGWRVPAQSIIFRAFTAGTSEGPAEEDLAWWTTSGGSSLKSCAVTVRALGRGSIVYAFVTPRANDHD